MHHLHARHEQCFPTYSKFGDTMSPSTVPTMESKSATMHELAQIVGEDPKNLMQFQGIIILGLKYWLIQGLIIAILNPRVPKMWRNDVETANLGLKCTRLLIHCCFTTALYAQAYLKCPKPNEMLID